MKSSRSFLRILFTLLLAAGAFFITDRSIRLEDDALMSDQTATSTEEILADEQDAASSSRPVLDIKGQSFYIDIADTDAERAQGLSGRAFLADDEALLFAFPSDGIYGFWMKDMLFSVDMIWADADGIVVHIAKNASPESYPKSFVPAAQSRYVLEVDSGTANWLGLKVGDRIDIPAFMQKETARR